MKKTLQLMALFLSIIIFSQNYTIKGKITDFHNKIPLENAEISLGNKKTFSDKNGKFIFENIAKGNYKIIVHHTNCNRFQKEIRVDENLDLSITLEHHEQEIETVKITAHHKNLGSIVVKTLDKGDLERNSTENLGNLLENISGVSTLKTGNNIAKPIIHGLYGSRISILNNGVKLAEQEWGIEHAPNVDPNNFEHIDVIKGASSLKYGSDAIGGVVILEPEIFKKKDTLKGKISLSQISNGKGIDFGLNLVKTWANSWAVKTSSSYKKSGDLHTPNYNLMNTGFDFNSFGFTVLKNEFKQGFEANYYVTNQQIGIFRGSHTGNLTDFYNAFNSETPIYQRDFSYSIDHPKQQILHQIFKISGYKRFENLGKFSVNYNFQSNHRKEFDIRRGDLDNLPSVDLTLNTNQMNINNLIEKERWNLETGINFSYQNNYSDPETKARRLIPNYNKYAAETYSIFKYKFSTKFNIEAGLRYNYNFYNVVKWFDETDWNANYASEFQNYFVENIEGRIKTKPQLKFRNLSVNAGFEYKPTENFDLKLNYAKVGRTPNIAELFAGGLHHSASVIEIGNLRLKNENGHQINLQIDMKLNVLEGLQISVNPYFFYTKNFINQIPTGVQNTIRGVFPVWTYQQINAKMYGIDADLHFNFTKNLDLKTSGSYLYGQDLSHNEPLILMSPARITNKLEYKNQDFRNFYFSVENQYVFKQNRYPIHNAEITDYIDGVEVIRNIDLSSSPNKYQLWSLQTGINLTKNFGVELSVNNICNKNYRDYLNRLRFFSNEIGRNFILTLKYNF